VRENVSVIETTLVLAVVAPVLAALAIILAVIDHLRAPEPGDWWFVACVAAFVIAAIPFSPFGFDYDSADLPYVWRLVTCVIVVLPPLLVRMVALLTGRVESRLVPATFGLSGTVVAALLLMPTFPGPTHQPAPLYYSISFGAFSVLFIAAIATCITWLAQAVRGAVGPARVRGILLLATFVPLGVLTGAWLAVPTESTEFAWSAVAFVGSLPFWLAIRAPRGMFQLLARESADPADGVARLVRSTDVRTDLRAALEPTRRAWGLHGIDVINADGGLVERVGAARTPQRAASRVVDVDGLAGGMRLVLHADTLSPTIRPGDRAVLELLASSIQLAFDRQDAAARTVAAVNVSAAAAEAIELANRRVEHADEATQRVLATVADELHEPAGALLGLTRTSESRWSELPPEQLLPLQALVARRVERIAATVEQLLLASAIQNGTLLGGREQCDVVELLRGAARTADIEDVVVDCPPDEANSCIVETDPLALRHVVAALVDNAARHGAGPIQLTVQRRADCVRVEVADHGDGVRNEFEGRLYDRFSRDSAPGQAGIGLGLAIARELVDSLGATLRYRRDGVRTVFEVLLPVTP
jgi:signal transduction histidine kinase